MTVAHPLTMCSTNGGYAGAPLFLCTQKNGPVHGVLHKFRRFEPSEQHGNTGKQRKQMDGESGDIRRDPGKPGSQKEKDVKVEKIHGFPSKMG
jgi:hypothetical protein